MTWNFCTKLQSSVSLIYEAHEELHKKMSNVFRHVNRYECDEEAHLEIACSGPGEINCRYRLKMWFQDRVEEMRYGEKRIIVYTWDEVCKELHKFPDQLYT